MSIPEIAKLKEIDPQEALLSLKKTLIKSPNDIACHTNLSNLYAATGNFEEALKHIYESLRLNPQHAVSYNNLGRLFYKQGQIEKSVKHFEKALRIDPNYWEAHYNLAHSLVRLNQTQRAIIHYQEAARILPDHTTTHYNLGLLYVEEHNFSLAERHLSEAFSADPSNATAGKFLAQAYVELGQISRAIELYEQVLIVCPTLAEAHHNLAVLYLRNQTPSKALTHFTAALNLDPNNDTAKHMIRALSHSKDTSAAPIDYILQLFDQYAPYYNQHVKIQLKYQAPFLLRNAFGRCLGQSAKALKVLDLGCGTGLCGIAFRDVALELTGIDLSPNMIAEAARLNAYEKLLVADLLQYLENSRDSFDLILAADVLCYSGALTIIFEKIHKALHKNGHFAFTIEAFEEDTQDKHLQKPVLDYTLQPTGRFTHSSTYILSLATEWQFSILLCENIILREHQGTPVYGQIYILRKS